MKMDVIPGRVNKLQVTPDRRGRLRRQVLRALRCLPLADALQRRGRQPGGVRRLPRSTWPTPATPPSSPCSVAPTSRDQAGLDDRLGRTQRVSAATTATPHAAAPPPERKKPLGQQVVRILTTTDHKLIGKMYLDHLVRVVPGRRPDGHADPLRAGLPGPAGRQRPALQPAVHDARHDHAAAVRDAAVLRLRQRDHAAADRRARRRVPAPQHVQLLAVPVRRPHRRVRLPHPVGRRRLRLVRLHAALRRRTQPGRRW